MPQDLRPIQLVGEIVKFSRYPKPQVAFKGLKQSDVKTRKSCRTNWKVSMNKHKIITHRGLDTIFGYN